MDFEWGFGETRAVGLSSRGSETRGLSDSMIDKRCGEVTVELVSETGFMHTGARVVRTVRDNAAMLIVVTFHDESSGLP